VSLSLLLHSYWQAASWSWPALISYLSSYWLTLTFFLSTSWQAASSS
jgi:hypothetical protein